MCLRTVQTQLGPGCRLGQQGPFMPPLDSIVDSLASIVGADAVLTRAEDLIPYSFDGTAALKERPAAVVFPRTTAQVAACVAAGGRERHADRHARLRHRPERRQRADAGLSSCSASPRWTAILDVDPRNLTVRAAGRRDHASASIEAAAEARPLLSARSRVDADLHHRRQRRRELGRPARPQIRRHARLRHGSRSRARRWQGHSSRQRNASRMWPAIR